MSIYCSHVAPSKRQSKIDQNARNADPTFQQQDSIRDACNPQPRDIALDTMRYRRGEKYKDRGSFRIVQVMSGA